MTDNLTYREEKTKIIDGVSIKEQGAISDNMGRVIGWLADYIDFEDIVNRSDRVDFLNAINIVTREIKKNKELYTGYKTIIAISFQDEYDEAKRKMRIGIEPLDIFKVANKAAERFLELWCQENSDEDNNNK